MRGTTESGFEFEVKEEALNDWELVEYMDDMEENPQHIIRVAKKLLGKEQYEQMKEHCREENGIVNFRNMTAEIIDILHSNSKTKN